MTWGETALGDNISALQDQLKNVRQIQATENVFDAVLVDGFSSPRATPLLAATAVGCKMS